MVVSGDAIKLYDGAEPPFFFHPSMALIRVKRLRKGEPDALVTLTGCAPGDTVIDCTAGMASDSIVLAYAAGEAGKVTALETEQLPYVIVREGLQQYSTGLPDVDEALRRIDMRLADHLAYLQEQPDNSADIVYFDPMFRRPIQESSALQPLRQLANASELKEEAVREAVRVARRCVVLKEHRDSPEFARLGFAIASSNQSKTAYGVITIVDE